MIDGALDIAAADPLVARLGLSRQDLLAISIVLQRARCADWSIDGIVRWVAAETGVPRRDILSPLRDARTYRARALVAWGARRSLRRSFPQIGRSLDRDHSSIMEAIRRAEQFRQTDDAFRDLADRLLATFSEEVPS